MKQKFIDYYMDIAERTAKLSHAKRLQVGSVIVKEHKILATGYNGTPTGWDNNCEDKVWDSGAGGWLDSLEIEQLYPYEEYHEQAERMVRYKLRTKPEVLHSEMNSLMKVAKSNESTDGAVLFCTHAPCLDCAKAIYQSGIKVVYYKNSYRNDDGLNFLQICGVDVYKLSNSL